MRVYPFARFLSAGNGALGRSAGGRSASADFLSTPSFGRTWRFWVCAGMLPLAFFSGMHLANYLCRGRGGLSTFHSLRVTTTARPPLLLLLQPGGSLKKPARRGSPFPLRPFVWFETVLQNEKDRSETDLPFQIIHSKREIRYSVHARFFPASLSKKG